MAVGIYIISTTCLINKDGTFYIGQAQLFQTKPLEVIKVHYFGCPFLIFLVHKVASVLGLPNGINGWIISAQSTTLMCMLATLVPLYFIGKSLVGKKEVFYALVILAFLPYPVRLATDVVRDWPHILFLSLSFAALIAAAKGEKWWLYSISGLLAGLGYPIRVECAQTVIYAFVWFTLCIISPRYRMTRKKTAFSALLLLVCFTAVVLPYLHIKQQYLPEQFRPLINESKPDESVTIVFTANLGGGLLKFAIKVFERIGENLFYYFFAFSLIGFYQRFIKGFKEVTDIEKVFVTSFILLNVAMLIWVFYNFNFASRRHYLPLSLFFLFYCPIGLKNFCEKISAIFKFKPTFLFYTFLVAGILLCLPKLLEPKRKDKVGILEAAHWLNQNTRVEDLIAVLDPRIRFYAQRNGFCIGVQDLKNADFAVAQVGAEDVEPAWGEKMVWFWIDPKKKDSKLIIYKLP